MAGRPGGKAIRKQPPSDRRGDREMVPLPAPRPATPKPLSPKRTAQAVKASNEVGQRLLAMLQESQQRSEAPLGMVKCPTCGTPIDPTRNGRIRVHTNALYDERCPSSGEPWGKFGKQPEPKPERSRAAKGKGSARAGKASATAQGRPKGRQGWA